LARRKKRLETPDRLYGIVYEVPQNRVN